MRTPPLEALAAVFGVHAPSVTSVGVFAGCGQDNWSHGNTGMHTQRGRPIAHFPASHAASLAGARVPVTSPLASESSTCIY